jgi:hypothetical protein
MLLVLGTIIVAYEGINLARIYSKDPCEMKDEPEKIVVTSQQGWSFLGITVGESNHKDIIRLLGDPDNRSPYYSKEKKTIGCVFQYILNKENIMDTNARYIWFSGSTVVAIQFSKPGYPLKEDNSTASLKDLKKLYGIPDIVGFSNVGPYYRTVIWLHKGIQASVRLVSETLTNAIDLDKTGIASIDYFSPMDIENFKESAFSTLTDKPSDGDVVDLFPKDPFDWLR